MPLPIKETPVLTGKDAVRFLEHMLEAETKPITDEERREYERGKRLYDECKKKEIERVLERVAARMQIDIDPEFAKVIEEEFWNLV